MLAACCAFAAPLLGPLGEQGRSFHLHGKSSSGKTTALRVAASVWGGEAGTGALGYVRQWRATGNGVEGLAQAHSDTLLAMDEIGTADPRRSAKPRTCWRTDADANGWIAPGGRGAW